jgi:hypothetical protein
MQSTTPDVVVLAHQFLQWLGVLVVAPAVSLIYFLTSPKDQPLNARVLASSPGLIVALFYLGAGLVHDWKLSKPSYGIPFAIALLLPIGLILLSFAIYRGPKYVHFLQLANLICIFWTFFVGGMAITGDWL